jgi:hypothetical protein
MSVGRYFRAGQFRGQGDPRRGIEANAGSAPGEAQGEDNGEAPDVGEAHGTSRR